MTHARFRPSLRWLSLLAIMALGASAEVKLPHIFSSNMVLQRGVELPVWGWASPGEDVTVTLDGVAPAQTKADAAGNWRVVLPAQQPGRTRTLTVKGTNEVLLDNILVGDVWLASGQSNMQWTVNASVNAADEIANSSHPNLRHIAVPRIPQSVPVNDFQGEWQVSGPEVVANWTAAGYFFGRELMQQLDIPIGILHSSWGGTRIEPWTPPEGFAGVPELSELYKQVQLALPGTELYKARLNEYLTALDAWTAKARQALNTNELLEPSPAYPQELLPPASKASPQQQPTTLYNGMIYPVLPFPIKGAIWYQGESNHAEGMLYAYKTKALVEGWRKVWNNPDLPYYFVQIAPYQYGQENPTVLAEFWEAQAAIPDLVPNTGMAVINDIGMLNDIHPKNKQEVGRRLALLALRDTYGKDIVAEGPQPKELKLEGKQLRVTFETGDGGLATRDGQAPSHFEIIGAGTGWVAAKASIDGESVVLTADGVDEPLAMRYAWHKLAEPNLTNKAGLPTSAFRMGEVPVIDYLKTEVKESANYELVYDLDLSKLGANPTYDVDNAARIAKKFDRIAYYLELAQNDGPTQWVYVSMDAFTDDLKKIAIPTVASKAMFQQKVTNANVLSNVNGITTGEGLATCNIEFWPHNYGPINSASIPNASAQLWDFGDQPSDPVDGYGCMQVHNYDAKQTIFAINQWKSGGNGANIGIGNSTGDDRTRDWTFVGNAGSYSLKRLRVLVHLVD